MRATERINVDEIEKLTAQFNENLASIERNNSNDAELAELIRKAQGERQRLRDNNAELRHKNQNISWELRTAKEKAIRLAAEAERRKALEPHFDHPRLQFLLRLLEQHPRYNDFKQFQKEDLVFMLDRWVFPLKTKGILNGNDTGLGKTMETATMLWTMELLETKIKKNEVPQELLDEMPTLFQNKVVPPPVEDSFEALFGN